MSSSSPSSQASMPVVQNSEKKNELNKSISTRSTPVDLDELFDQENRSNTTTEASTSSLTKTQQNDNEENNNDVVESPSVEFDIKDHARYLFSISSAATRSSLMMCSVVSSNKMKSAAQFKYQDLDIEKGVIQSVESGLTDSSSTELKSIEEEEKTPETKQQKEEPNKRCRDHPRVVQLYTTADWWSLWIGLATFGIGMMLVFCVPYELNDERVKYVVPQPKKWTSNPFDAWDLYGVIGTLLLLSVLAVMYLISCKFMGKLSKSEHALRKHTCGFAFMSVLAALAFWIGRNEWCAQHGLGYAVFSIVLGMLVTNVPVGNNQLVDKWLGLAAKDGEFFIKCSLVLLAVELSVLGKVGAPGMIVAWVGSPLAIILGYVIAVRCFKCQDSLAVVTTVGASWCGASAISAVAPIVSASSEHVSLAISVVAFFTLIFTFAQPYIALAVNMPDKIAGSWIGASVDQTGNVIVSAAIVSPEATEVAGIVKMVLNAGLGVLATIIACWWGSRKTESSENDAEPRNKVSLVYLWDKFPKFTIGFIITSGILTGVMQAIEGTAEGEALPTAISTLNRWWFAIAFVGIGLTTNIRKLWKGAIQSGIIQVYLVTNLIDILLALGLSYALFR